MPEKSSSNKNKIYGVVGGVLKIYDSNDKQLKKGIIIIPEGVQKLGDYCFSKIEKGKVKKVYLPSSLKEFNSKAFDIIKKDVEEVIFEDGIKEITDFAFDDWKSLSKIRLSKKIRKIGKRAFSVCDDYTRNCKFDDVFYDGTIEDWLKIEFVSPSSNPMSYAKNFYLLDRNGNIEYEGKKYRLLTNLNVPEGTTIISSYQFYRFNQIDEMTLPKSLITVKSSSFEGIYKKIRVINRSSIKITDYFEYPIVLLNSEDIITCDNIKFRIIDGECNAIGVDEYCSDIIFPEKVIIGDKVYSQYKINSDFTCGKMLDTIKIPNSVFEIGSKAFSNRKVKRLIIGNGVSYIGEGAFCISHYIIGVPNSWGEVRKEKVKIDIYYNGTIEDWLKISFCGENSNPLSVMDSNDRFYILDNDGNYDFDEKKYSLVDELLIPDGTSRIKAYQFNGLNNLNVIKIPLSVNNIGEYAFLNCCAKQIKYDGTIDQWELIKKESRAFGYGTYVRCIDGAIDGK